MAGVPSPNINVDFLKHFNVIVDVGSGADLESKYCIEINVMHSNFSVAYLLFCIAVIVNKQKFYIALEHLYYFKMKKKTMQNKYKGILKIKYAF